MLKQELEQYFNAKVEEHTEVVGYTTRLEALKKLKWLSENQLKGVQDIYILHNDKLEVILYTITEEMSTISHAVVVKNTTTESTKRLQQKVDTILHRNEWLEGRQTTYLTVRVVNILSEMLEETVSGLESLLELEKLNYDALQHYGKMHKHLIDSSNSNTYLLELRSRMLSMLTLKYKNKEDYYVVVLETENMTVTVGAAVDKHKVTNTKEEAKTVDYEYMTEIKGIENNAPKRHALIQQTIEEFVKSLPTNLISYIA